MIWINLILIIILALALFKQYSDTKRSVKKTKELIFSMKDSLEKDISEIKNKVEKLETRVSALNPEGIAERIANIKKEIEESLSNRLDKNNTEMEKLRALFGNYVSNIEERIGLADKIAQKISRISANFGKKIKSFRIRKTK